MTSMGTGLLIRYPTAEDFEPDPPPAPRGGPRHPRLERDELVLASIGPARGLVWSRRRSGQVRESDVEDLVQVLLVRLLEVFPRWPRTGPWEPWAWVVMENALRAQLQVEARQRARVALVDVGGWRLARPIPTRPCAVCEGPTRSVGQACCSIRCERRQKAAQERAKRPAEWPRLPRLDCSSCGRELAQLRRKRTGPRAGSWAYESRFRPVVGGARLVVCRACMKTAERTAEVYGCEPFCAEHRRAMSADRLRRRPFCERCEPTTACACGTPTERRALFCASCARERGNAARRSGRAA